MTAETVRKLSDTASVSVSRLKAAWSPLKRILTFSPADDVIAPKKSLAASLEKGGVSVVYGSRFLSRMRLTAFRRYAFEGDKFPQPEDLASSLALAAKEFASAKTDITLVIPKAWTIIRTAQLPSTVKENLPDVIYYEIDRLTPFAPDKTFFDFHILKEDGERLTVLLMATNAEMVAPYINALGERGLKVACLSVDLSSMGTFCRYADKLNDNIFIRIDENGYGGAMFIDGMLEQTFSSAAAAPGKGSWIEGLAAEVSGMVDAVKARGKKAQVFALFTGSNPSLKEAVKARLDTTVRFLGEVDPGLSLPRAMKDVPFAALGGMLESLWPAAKGLNLLRKGKTDRPKNPVGLTVILILAILVVGALNVAAPVRREEGRLASITQQINIKKKEALQVEDLRKEVDSLKGEMSTINNFKKDNPLMLNLLKELTVILPKTTWLTRVRMTDTTVQIEGYSDSATSLLPKLEASPYLKKVEFASPTFRDRRMNADRFNISMEIEGLKRPGSGEAKKETKSGDEKK